MFIDERYGYLSRLNVNICSNNGTVQRFSDIYANYSRISVMLILFFNSILYKQHFSHGLGKKLEVNNFVYICHFVFNISITDDNCEWSNEIKKNLLRALSLMSKWLEPLDLNKKSRVRFYFEEPNVRLWWHQSSIGNKDSNMFQSEISSYMVSLNYSLFTDFGLPSEKLAQY